MSTERPAHGWRAIRSGVSLAAAALVLAMGPAADRADAGTFVATNCSTEWQQAADASSLTNTSVYPRSTDCAGLPADTGMRILNSGGVGATYAYGAWSWTAPAGTVFADLNFSFRQQSASGHTASITATAEGGGLIGRWWPASGYADGQWHAVDTIPITAKHFNAWLECAASCPPSATAYSYVKNLYFTISDPIAPQLAALGGELLGGGVRRGTEDLVVTGTDNVSITAASVRANGVLMEARDAVCGGLIPDGPATSFHPCASATGWTIPVNTELLPDGQNSIEVCIYDLAFDPGARNAACETRTIQVDNSCPSSGGTRASAIEGGLQAGNGPARPTIRVRSRRGATARGTLRGPGSVAGATVCLYEQVDLPGDGRELVDTARVRSDGDFALEVAPGPSRSFDIVYRYNNQTVERERLHLESVVAPTFKLVGKSRLRNGQNVRFRGRIPGPNADGRGISLQARAGRKWRTFKQVKANSRGVFRGLYRFTQTLGRARYTFRARVKRQGNYPYSPGHSRRRQVRVSG